MRDKTAAPAGVAPWQDPNAAPFIRIEGLTKQFGTFTAVDNVSLDIYKNELFCLLGGSGSGKSTLLRMLAGFESPTAGRIEIDGQDMSAVPPNARQTNMMFQSYALFPHMSVEKNIAYGLKCEGMGRSEIATRVTEMLSLVQLDDYAARKPHQLSGGQQQRVALARALAKRPKLLLLDEPLGALDKKLREETQFELINIQENLGVTFIVVTHDQEEAMTLATRIGVMTAGRIAQVGDPHDIYEFPQSRFVADFIGSVNIFEGTVVEDDADHVVIRPANGAADIYVSHGISCVLGQKVAVAVRPEKVQVFKSRPEARTNIVSGRVAEIGYLGNITNYLVRLQSGETVRAAHANLSRNDEDAPRHGDEVFLTWGGAAGVVLTA